MNFELTSKISHKTLLILHQKGLCCSLLLRLCQPDITWREQWRSEKRIEDIHQWRCRIIDILKINQIYKIPRIRIFKTISVTLILATDVNDHFFTLKNASIMEPKNSCAEMSESSKTLKMIVLIMFSILELVWDLISDISAQEFLDPNDSDTKIKSTT